MSGGRDECWVGWGRWQARLALLLALPVLLTGAYGTNYVFLAAPTPHRCHVPECEGMDSEGVAEAGRWSPPWTHWAIPAGAQCERYVPTGGGCTRAQHFQNTTIPCDRYVYEHGASIVAEFGLACADWMQRLVGTVHNVGTLISLPIMGFVSDRWGRRAALIISCSGAGAVGLLKSFVPSYVTYLLAELLETVVGASVYPCAFVLMIEWLGVKHRIFASLVLGIPLSLGAASLAGLDYVTGYWRTWARFAYLFCCWAFRWMLVNDRLQQYPPALLLLLYPWLLPESVRWLVSRGRLDDAAEVIKEAAKFNRIHLPSDTLEKILVEKEQCDENVEPDIEEGLFKALIKYGALRRRLCVCCAWWASAVFVFYGLAVAADGRATFALAAIAELPALVANTLLLDRAGRRPLLTAALLLTATALISLSCLPQDSGWWRLSLFLVGKVGATMTLNALYVYTAELFPTRARQRLLAACSAIGRLGGVMAPLAPALAVYKWWLPTALFGFLPLMSAALTRLVPDTLHQRLPESFADLDTVSEDTQVSV